MTKFILFHLSLFLFSINSFATDIRPVGQITRIASSKDFNGCLIELDTEIGGSCPSKWVSLDCNSSVFANGQERLKAASAAAIAKRKVKIYVDENKRTTGNYCKAYRIDVYY